MNSAQTPPAERIDKMRQLLQEKFQPSHLDIRDDSHLHAGHAGARSGAGHYRVELVSAAFSGKPTLACHRMVYAALDEMMGRDIHALSISTRAG